VRTWRMGVLPLLMVHPELTRPGARSGRHHVA
jgi:hypothetical protein